MFTGIMFAAVISGMDAYAFNNTVGINTHLVESFSPSNNLPFTTSMLRALNIHHIRDSLAIEPGLNSVYSRYLQSIDDSDKADAIRSDQLVGTVGWQASNIVHGISFWGVDYLEGPNEADIQNDPAWLAHTQALMTQIALAQKTFPGIVSIAPTVEYADPATLGIRAQLGNMHDYFSVFNPETIGYGGDVYNNGTLYGSEAYNIALAQRAVPGAAVVSTESGWDTTLVSESVQASYLVRLTLVHAMNNIVRGYIYNLFDDVQHFGVVRSDGSMKPAAYALSGFLNIVYSPTPTTGACTVAASAVSATPLMSFVLCKANGEKDVILWDPSPITSTSAVSFASVAYAGAVRVYVPDASFHYLENDAPNLSAIPYSATPTIVQLNAGPRPVLPLLPSIL